MNSDRLSNGMPGEAPQYDVGESARAAGLVWVSDSQPGFRRVLKGKVFVYMDGPREVDDERHLQRIQSLVIPPAWEEVWICKRHNGHLQATGKDKRGRKQYKYHPLWTEFRNRTKFHKLREFGERLPLIRANLNKDLSLRGYPQRKVLAAVVSLLERVNIRIGNAAYEKLYGSFGLTTLKNRHARVNGSELRLSFRGKKGIPHKVSLKSRRLARIVQACKELPGKELFEYYDEAGEIRPVDSGMVNDYIREIAEGDFTAKDFRTWAGSIQALLAFRQIGGYETKTEMNRKIPAALDLVAQHLGNTRAVCRKYYVHPLIIDLYQEGGLESYLEDLNQVEEQQDQDGYALEEKVLLKILAEASLQSGKILEKALQIKTKKQKQ